MVNFSVAERLKDGLALAIALVYVHFVDRRTAGMIGEHARIRDGFEDRLYDAWRPALNNFQALIAACFEVGELHAGRRAETDEVAAVLAHLHAFACQLASEIDALLRSGHPHGAHGRWRTLHETAVTMAFVRANGRAAAIRFVEHEAVQRKRLADAYNERAAGLGEPELTPAELADVHRGYDAAVAKHGRGFERDYGWATPWLDHPSTFREIEDRTPLKRFRARYRWASESIHPSARTLTARLGADAPGVLLAGPSNTGLADPGIDASESLFAATAELLGHRPDMPSRIYVHVLGILRDRSGRAFFECGRVVDAITQRNIDAQESASRG